jgi:hypothetical protein
MNKLKKIVLEYDTENKVWVISHSDFDAVSICKKELGNEMLWDLVVV